MALGETKSYHASPMGIVEARTGPWAGPWGRRGPGPSGLLRPDTHHRLGLAGVQAKYGWVYA